MRPLSLLAALLVLLLNACYSAGDGKAPPLEELYFPTGLALDRLPRIEEGGAPKYLYVVNSDFDLQYRAASMISYDLDLLRNILPRNCNQTADCQGDEICDAPGVDGIPTDDPARVPSFYCVNRQTTINQRSVERPCGAFGDRDEADQVLNPGRCKSADPINPQDGSPTVLVDTVGIGAFATDVIWRANPDQSAKYPARLFIPVRGDSTLHWIDVNDGKFACGQNGDNDNGCDDRHRAGDAASANIDQLRQPAEPYALDATADGAFVGVTNQTSGSVSLFANDWRPDGGPRLVSILTGLPLAPVGIAALPEPVFASGARPAPGFLVAYRTAAQIDLLRVRSDDADTGTALVNYTDYTLTRAGAVPINASSLGFDSRGITIDDQQRQKDYEACQKASAGCGTDSAQCQADLSRCLRAVHQPVVYVASRAPASLLVGAMTTDIGYPAGTSELPSFGAPIPLTFGPSRVIMGDVKVPGTTHQDIEGTGTYDLERRVFVVCFDSRRIFVYDPKRRAIDSIISTGRGPYALAVDSVRGLAYLGHFTDSYLGVVSLDQRFPQTYATIVASIGAPKAPRSSK